MLENSHLSTRLPVQDLERARAFYSEKLGLKRSGRLEERGNLVDLDNLYLNPSRSAQKVPLAQVATRRFSAVPEKIQRRNQLRTISVVAFPASDKLPSEVMKQVHPKLQPILGAGRMADALGRRFVDHGHKPLLSFSRDRATLEERRALSAKGRESAQRRRPLTSATPWWSGRDGTAAPPRSRPPALSKARWCGASSRH